MRYIPLREKIPPKKWLKKAEGLLETLKSARTSAERAEIIDKNSAVWGELKTWLLELSHQKCWFTEAKDCFSHWHVEHYRPKKRAVDGDGAAGDGYWWLAFDWQNFRICGSVGNAKKGAYFPLRPGSRRATDPNADLREEHPELLDPADEDDPVLIWFNFEGTAEPHPQLGQGWDRGRVQISINRYELNFGPLADRRKVVWGECWRLIQKYREELGRLDASDGQSAIARSHLKESSRAIRAMIREDSELSSVARTCVASTGDPRLLGLLRSI